MITVLEPEPGKIVPVEDANAPVEVIVAVVDALVVFEVVTSSKPSNT